MDSLKALGCCHIYSQRDFTLEGEGQGDQEGRHDGAVAAALAKKQADAGLDAFDCPPSPTIMARWGRRRGTLPHQLISRRLLPAWQEGKRAHAELASAAQGRSCRAVDEPRSSCCLSPMA